MIAASTATSSSTRSSHNKAGGPPSSSGSSTRGAAGAAVAVGVAGSAVPVAVGCGEGVGVGSGVAVAVGCGEGVGVGSGVAVAVGCGEGVGVGSGVAVAVGCGEGVGVGSGVAVAVGCGEGVGVGSGVAVGTGVGVGAGPTRMAEAPPTLCSVLAASRRTPVKIYRPSAAGAVTVYVTRSTPNRVKLTVWPSTNTAAAFKSDATKVNPAGRVSLSRPKPPYPEAATVTRSSPPGSTHGTDKDRVARCVDATVASGCKGPYTPSRIATRSPSRTNVLTAKALPPCNGNASPQPWRGLPSPDVVYLPK